MAEDQDQVEEQEGTSRSQMWKHEDFVEWATDEGLLTEDSSQAETIAVFAANRNRYRKTQRYLDLVEGHKVSIEAEREARKAERAAAAEAKAAERAAAKEAKEAAKAEAAAAKEAEASKTPAKATKAAAKKTTAKATKATAAKGGDENPFS